MAVCIRMKKFGRAHRHFFRICATDKRSPRDGKVLEELGTYDPMIKDMDARAILNNERVDYWLSVGAQPSEKCAILIKKYGTNGTHADKQREALDRMAMPLELPDPGEPASLPKSEQETPAEGEAAATPAAEGDAAAEQKPAEDSAEPKAEEAAAQPAEGSSEEKPEEAKSE